MVNIFKNTMQNGGGVIKESSVGGVEFTYDIFDTL
jgi:hypothetical protein